MLKISCSTKPLNTIIKIGIYFDIVELCSTAYTSKGQTIDFIIGLQFVSTMADRYISEYTTVVSIISTSIGSSSFCTRNAFYVEFTTIDTNNTCSE